MPMDAAEPNWPARIAATFAVALVLVARRIGWEPSPTLWLVTELFGTLVLIAMPGAAGPNRFGPPNGLSGTADGALAGSSDRRGLRRKAPGNAP